MGAEPKKSGHHAHEAPHGGSLVEFGDEFAHLELVLDEATGTLIAYALDGEAERPVRVAQPSVELILTVPGVAQPVVVTLAPVENTLTGEKAGDTSQFRAEVAELKGQKTFAGVVTGVTLRGRTFTHVAFEFPSTDH